MTEFYGWESEGMKRQPAVFFERDGVLHVDRGYMCRKKELEWMPGAIEAIRMLNEREYFVFVATNQVGLPEVCFGKMKCMIFTALWRKI